MNRRWMRLTLLVAFLLVLTVADAAGISPASLPSSLAADPTPPSSAPLGAQPSHAGPVAFVETDPVLPAAGPDAPAAVWNKTLRYVGNVFKPRSNTVNYAVEGDGGCVHVTSGASYEVWNVPLVLPEGAQVQLLRMYYYDNDAAQTMQGWFTKYDLYGNIVQEWLISSTTSAAAHYTDVTITPAQTIDYGAYSYVINMRPNGIGTNMKLCGFRVFFYQPLLSAVNAPAILK